MAKQSLRERLKKKQEELRSRGQQGAIFFQKADTTIRVRILGLGEEEEFIKEVTQFYLGADLKGVISPATFGEPCAIYEAYEELKNSEDDGDKELSSKFPPRQRYLAFCLFYKDGTGKEIDENISPKFLLITGGVYQEILELYLDEDEWGDMTEPENGYDIKIKRTGSGKTDTEYTVTACKPTPVSKPYRKKTYDIDEELRKIMPTYEQTKQYIDQYLGLGEDENNDEPVRKSKKKGSRKKLLRTQKNTDLDE